MTKIFAYIVSSSRGTWKKRPKLILWDSSFECKPLSVCLKSKKKKKQGFALNNIKSLLGFFPQAPSINNLSLCISRSASLSITSSLRQGAGAALSYKSDGDSCHLALLCKLPILVSFKVFGMESHCICPFRYCLGPCIRKFTKNVVTSVLVCSPLSHTLIGLP